MPKFALFLLAIIVIVLVGGVVVLSTRDIPPPTAHVEKPIPNDRLPK
ncbi:MAG TPA: hypothetical protein VEU47_20450 [Candidatus Cybelea sp.]|nr:hypothetical protein [Candidatus Cybelea sp.]